MTGNERHHFHQALCDKEVAGVVGVNELQLVAQFGNPVLYLNPGVHFHEVVRFAIDDTFKGADRVQLHRFTENGALFFHARQDLEILFKLGHFGATPGSTGFFNRRLQLFNGDRYFQQLLLVHLQGAVTTAHGHAPLTVTLHLDFLVSGGVDIHFNQNVFIVAHTVGLELNQAFLNQRRNRGGGLFNALFQSLALVGVG